MSQLQPQCLNTDKNPQTVGAGGRTLVTKANVVSSSTGLITTNTALSRSLPLAISCLLPPSLSHCPSQIFNFLFYSFFDTLLSYWLNLCCDLPGKVGLQKLIQLFYIWLPTLKSLIPAWLKLFRYMQNNNNNNKKMFELSTSMAECTLEGCLKEMQMIYSLGGFMFCWAETPQKKSHSLIISVRLWNHLLVAWFNTNHDTHRGMGINFTDMETNSTKTCCKGNIGGMGGTFCIRRVKALLGEKRNFPAV